MTDIQAPCIVRVDGTVEPYPPKGDEFTLEEMQAAVGGYIERVPHWPHHDTHLFANEEGLLRGLELNVRSLELAGIPLVGDLLIVPKRMVS